MATHTSTDSSRKPSGSSSHSGGHSPSGSPSNAQQRKLTPNGAMFGTGPGGIKGLNAGWQVWGAATPGSKRNPSVSSAASATELPQGENAYRGNMAAEGWNGSKPSTGAWEDANGSPKKKDFGQLRQANAAQAASLSVPRTDANGVKQGQYSPQRYENNLGKETSPRYPSGTSPTNVNGFTSFPQAQPLQSSNSMENDLVSGMRGMAVEDDYGASNQMPRAQPGRSPYSASSAAGYSGYPQTEYPAYYPNTAVSDFQYGYAGSDPAYYASNAAAAMGASPQPGSPYYDYQQAGRASLAGSQFYYPPQMMYPPSPMLAQQVSNSGHLVDGPATLAARKKELQIALTHNIGPYGSRSTPSPHPQYGNGLDYNSQVMLQNGAMYGHGGQSMQHAYSQQTSRGSSRRHDGSEVSVALRSPLLDEFRANKARKWELRDIFHYIVEFSGDQHGSRFIQQKLETATSEEKQIIFDEIVPDNALQLIQDVFGNYVIQKLFEHGTQVQKTLLASTMEGHVLTLSMQMYGCRVVQKAVEFVLPEQQGAFVRELDAHVLKCVKDANGNHVIQKLIERVSADRLAFVASFRGNVYELATHPYGCRVLQRCFEHLPEEQTRPLLEELHKYIINLMQDQFGNYVVQFVLEHGMPQDRALVIAKLRGQMLQMARHKFASNVCEKALVTSDLENRRILIDEIMTPKQDGVSPIITMMKDQFANYVLQRALAVAEGEQREELISKVRPQLVSMRRYSSAYSKHLISIERLLERNGMPSKVDNDFRVTPHIEVSN